MADDFVKCPRCNAQMVCRENHKTGEIFLGCSNYPECTGTRNLSEAKGKSFSTSHQTHGECNRCGCYCSDLSSMGLCPSCDAWFENQ